MTNCCVILYVLCKHYSTVSPILKDMSEKIALKLGVNFHCPNGWLQCFHKYIILCHHEYVLELHQLTQMLHKTGKKMSSQFFCKHKVNDSFSFDKSMLHWFAEWLLKPSIIFQAGESSKERITVCLAPILMGQKSYCLL
jgi:hypothetical protein